MKSTNTKDIQYELSVLEMDERNKEEVEWSSGYFNVLINSLIQNYKGEIIIEKRERPDFKFIYPNINLEYTFEVTMATNEAYQAASRKISRGKDGTIL